MIKKMNANLQVKSEIGFPELEVMNSEEVSRKFDDLLEARDALFENRMKKGTKDHEEFLSALKKI